MEIYVEGDRKNSEKFMISAGVIVYNSIWDKEGRKLEYLRISNYVNSRKLSVGMSTCFPSDFELAEKINECYTQAFARAKLEMSFNKYED